MKHIESDNPKNHESPRHRAALATLVGMTAVTALLAPNAGEQYKAAINEYKATGHVPGEGTPTEWVVGPLVAAGAGVEDSFRVMTGQVTLQELAMDAATKSDEAQGPAAPFEDRNWVDLKLDGVDPLNLENPR